MKRPIYEFSMPVEQMQSGRARMSRWLSLTFDEKMDNKQGAELLRKAVDGHRKYTTIALMGEGIDRHLLGLKSMAFENKLLTPAFYNSPGYIKSLDFRVSTSQVAMDPRLTMVTNVVIIRVKMTFSLELEPGIEISKLAPLVFGSL
ncbi:carnitine O-acetyltransferase-like [Glossina fuscipes fuscipes]